MSTNHHKLKTIKFSLDGNSFECQIQTWTLNPGLEEGERMYAFCPDGEFFEEPTPEGTLEVTFYADWRSGGVNDFLTLNSGQIADFVLEHMPNDPDQHVQWTGKLRLYAPPAGGEARATETTEMTFQLVGDVSDGYSRVP